MSQSEARAWWADVEEVRATIERRRAAERPFGDDGRGHDARADVDDLALRRRFRGRERPGADGDVLVRRARRPLAPLRARERAPPRAAVPGRPPGGHGRPRARRVAPAPAPPRAGPSRSPGARCPRPTSSPSTASPPTAAVRRAPRPRWPGRARTASPCGPSSSGSSSSPSPRPRPTARPAPSRRPPRPRPSTSPPPPPPPRRTAPSDASRPAPRRVPVARARPAGRPGPRPARRRPASSRALGGAGALRDGLPDPAGLARRSTGRAPGIR